MKKYLFTLLAGLIGLYSYGQNELEDSKALLESYVAPLGYSLGAALNNGWYNTAKPHHLGGFDFTITTNIVIIPLGAKTFTISDANSGTFTGDETPTILGEGNGGTATYSSTDMEMPKGLNIPVLPMPVIQAGVGLIKNTEIDVRYMPALELKGVSTELYGFGIKHDILQWLPIVDKLPLSVSFQAGYTKLSSSLELNDPSNTIKPKANLDISATTINLLLSKKLLMFTPYLGVGYNSTKTTFNIDGEYNIARYKIEAKDLTSIEFKSSNELRANIGFRFNIAILALQANYTISKYPTATVGVGISLR